MSILSNIFWAFKRQNYPSIEDFNNEVKDYQKRILKDKASWDPEKIVIDAPEIDVCYEAWIRGKENISTNETLLESEKDPFHQDNSENGMFQVELCATLKAANGTNFTALDLLHQLQNQVSNKELGDHLFFEGLTPQSPGEQKQDKPLYYMYCGS
ncbi:hypothetical protein [Chryseobacterium angstadtii]|uniref:hypothetical protein n=1 Tax=Chryseobacterium angstadtii TaxID=558151 RepID=UPI00065A98A0|nr:hypothetical protein [Chryseobacterium angstadtii]